VVTSEGGAMSRLLREHGAGWVVPPGDAPALARAIVEALAAKPPAAVDAAPPSALDQAPPSSAWRQGAVALLAAYRWERALAPLLRFCREPRCELSKERFVHPLVSATPPDSAGFRLRRRLRRLWRRVAGRSLPSRPARGPRSPATDPGRPPR
jgi:hypothetical protein